MSILEEVSKLHVLFIKKGWSLAVAESCTGGLISHLITEVAGASKFFLGSIVAYDEIIKTGVLGVSEDVIKEKGVISAECARSMALAVKRLFGATVGLSTTGNLGPEAQGLRPVGEIFIGYSGPEGEDSLKIQLNAERRENKFLTAKRAIEFLLSKIDCSGS